MSTTVFGPVRAPGTAVGQTKDWLAIALPDRLVIGYGRTGHALRRTVLPQTRCVWQDPAQEGRRRLQEKLAEGYQPVPLTGPREPWIERFLTSVTGTPPPADAANAAPIGTPLYWEVVPTAAIEGAVYDILATVQSALAAHLQLHLEWVSSGVIVTMTVADETLDLPLVPPLKKGGETRSPGLQALLLALRQRLPVGVVRLADAQGREIVPAAFLDRAGWRQDDRRRALAVGLGLLPHALDFSVLAAAAPPWFL